LWRLGFGKRITWTFVPTSADVVGTLGESLLVYHCVDEYAAFSDAAAEVADAEKALLRKADLVLASSETLLQKKRAINPRTFLLLHGVDYGHFRKSTEESTPVAPELLSLSRPILGFHGLIADWVDLPLLAELARKQPDWSVVLIGRVDTDLAALRCLPNVHVLGHRLYAQLPSYLKGFDVAILPFVCNELTLSANPLKLREYLSAGLPVVAAPLPEVLRFNGQVAIAATAEQYICHVQTLLNRGEMGPSRERSDGIAGESWDHKMTMIEELLSLLPGARSQALECGYSTESN
jgi:glycosyltransferase involved in cell wall biosynthesis